ncbi:tyrosine-type recombinase/integrase [Burkholderia multivorans]|uniref:tyrosine-type recombinase/integrase n=1 Tax=Burkholderia multivorans TaxID=87883 RepID=UPI0019CF776C|nr:site-specific integrase [Burkholderia multivorans]MBN6729310.1 tyrosine-type recombinase/integrase [Burkholderia multivorans]MBN6737133.1 tyrosine-type recombinase/integrase [Burkholderia multivorans]MBN7125787.1 tyrosine-type recombinase/integrase [Burkholderia multivorans]MBN8167649.1 tyrosine-type recombinase/integrase [Burkholderia multivorans]QSL25414.1 tyrosine-type recombinase/integrase [Burkholderia multivorans]
MLTDRELSNLTPREKPYKVSDRDGLYVAVLPTGTRSFRFDYRLNGRRETLAIGRYDADLARMPARDPDALEYGMGISLREARTLLDRARREVERGVSPSRAKAEKRTAAVEARTFAGWAESYFTHKADPKSGAEQLADSTLAFRRSTYRRVIGPELGKLKLEEVTPQRLKRLCDDAKAKRGPAVAIHVREIVQAVFRHAQGSGQAVSNPADSVRASTIATFEPRDRALSPAEIRKFLTALEQVATTPTLRLALRFVLLTGVRKSEFIDATWAEIDFDAARWTIPASRMKAGKAHVVPLSEQALDILTALRSCFAASRYLHPGRYDHDLPISNATLNRVIDAAVERIREDDPEFQSFGVHDLRRTFSTGLNRAKFDERWIEMSLAHAPRNRIAAVYNVNRYLGERKIMLQCWADMIDAWMRGESARDLIADAKRRAAEVHDDELDDDM